MVVGGGEGGVRVLGGVLEKNRVKIVFFMMRTVFIICRSRLASPLSRSPLFALSVTIRA